MKTFSGEINLLIKKSFSMEVQATRKFSSHQEIFENLICFLLWGHFDKP
jgi:hypothetical protein